jgi:hypothetical protein
MTILTLSQSATACGINGSVSFLGLGGVPPYEYSLIPFGSAGGTINASSGAYQGPISISTNPLNQFETIVVSDSLGNQSQSRLLVGSPFLLFCDILQNQMNLPNGRVWIWNSKIFEPMDNALFIVLSVASTKIISNSNFTDVSGPNAQQIQSASCAALIDIDIKSRDTSAMDRKEEIVLAVNSVYAQQQMEANNFSILINTTDGFKDLSGIDGSAIPYRFRASFKMFYATYKITPIQYFDTFSPVQIATDA